MDDRLTLRSKDRTFASPSFSTPSSLLVQVIQDLSRTRSLADIQAIVRTAARRLTGADGATFVLRDGDQCYYADEDAIAPLWKGRRFPMKTCISGWAMLNRSSVVIEDIYADSRIPADAYRPTFVKSLVMMPIRTAEPIGAIGAYWAQRRAPTASEVAVLQALADSTSIALENVALVGELKTLVEQRTADLEAMRITAEEARHELEERKKAEAALKRVEAQFRQAQKMEAVGQLASGIAHDFNNMLSVVLTYGSLALDDLGGSDPVRGHIEEICKAGERAAALTRQLLAFSRQQVLEPRPLDVCDVVRDMEKMLHRIIGENISLAFVSAPAPHVVRADRGQIEQVLMNLVVNARDAMPEGGKLTIETAQVELDGDYVTTHLGIEPGAYVMLAVSDTGTGMDAATQARVFDPFFTTKEVGRGTGLGLSTVYGIVKQSGGHIWLYSEPGRGTTFKIYLPRLSGADEADAPAEREIVELRGNEHVLLVEDEPQVRAAAKGILERAGYRVVAAQSPLEAVERCRSGSIPIDLVLTDIVMPQMSGVQLVETMRGLRPDLKFVCMSGYTDEAALRHGVVELGLAYLQKPITPRSLLVKVRQVLDEPG